MGILRRRGLLPPLVGLGLFGWAFALMAGFDLQLTEEQKAKVFAKLNEIGNNMKFPKDIEDRWDNIVNEFPAFPEMPDAHMPRHVENFQASDLNWNGQVSLEEIAAKYPHGDRARQLLERWDKDKNGYVSLPEYVKAMKEKREFEL